MCIQMMGGVLGYKFSEMSFFPFLGFTILGLGDTVLCSLAGKVVFTNQRS